MNFLPLLGSLWTQSKWVLILSLLAFSHYVAFSAGQKNILRENAKEQSKLVLEERKRGSEAVKRASEATARVKDLERTNEELLSKLNEIPDRVLCPIGPDELRLLEDIRKSTE